jgi:hypothetical protein
MGTHVRRTIPLLQITKTVIFVHGKQPLKKWSGAFLAPEHLAVTQVK